MPIQSPMIWGVLLLMLLPIIGTILWIVKKLLKLSVPVAKVLLVLFAAWFLFTALTGGLSQAFGNISKPRIQQEEDGTITYLSAFSSTEFSMGDYAYTEKGAAITTAFGKVTIQPPQDTVLRVTVRGMGIRATVPGQEGYTVIFGEEQFTVGSGTRALDVTVNGAFLNLAFETGALDTQD